jgi:hypothetical protein
MAFITLAFALASLVVIGIGAQQGQRYQKYEEAMKASRDELDKRLPIVDYNEPKPTESSDRARRLAKDRRHNLGNHPITEGMTESSTVYHWPENFPALPVEQSTSIVTGEILEANAHISEDRSGVYSEFVVNVDKVLKDKWGIASSVVAEREGGRVRFPSGSTFRYFVDGFGIPEVGHRYLLFLKRFEDGGFSIITGYELLKGRVIPLDRSGVVRFDIYNDSDAERFITEVLEAIKKEKFSKV